MNMTVSTVDAQNGFYPTPPALAKKLLEGISWHWESTKTILEPSAGIGNLVAAIAEEMQSHYDRHDVEIDMIEIDPAIRGILSDRFSEDAMNKMYHHKESLRDAYLAKSYAKEECEAEKKAWQDAEHTYYGLQALKPHVVHDDFMTFNSRKHYDLIVMNPPFQDGDAHLLKAIQMQERYGGTIRCILNAETLRNPYTNRRKILMQKLQQLGAEISYEENAFRDADRQARVDVAIIKISIPMPTYESDIFNRLKKAQEESQPKQADPTDLVENDFVKQIIKQFELEADTGCELIRQYIATMPYIQSSYDKELSKPIIQLAINSDHACCGIPSVNDFLKAVRKKYWKALFQHPKFTRQLTSKLQSELYHRVNEMEAVDFSEFNIRCLMAEMNARVIQGIQDAIMELFETLTAKHAYYDECKANIHYYNGWCSNKAHKINSKVIIPINGAFAVYGWTDDVINIHNIYSVLSDIERALNYLDGNVTIPVNLERQLRLANSAKKTKNIQLKYFDVSFYKKGTCHIKFTCPELLDRFNIYASRCKAWLPPCYGKKTYAEMDTSERSVVDGFHGDGTEGSGETGYASVLARPGYYLAQPNCQQLTLEEG